MDQLIINNILEFWFGAKEDEEHFPERLQLWWGKDLTVDDYISKNFMEHLEKAVLGEYEQWLGNSSGTLALILLADQFSRHIYRNKPKAFSADSKALVWAQTGIDRGYDKGLSLFRRAFFYMPFEHAENINFQEQSVSQFYALYQESPPRLKKIFSDYYDYACQHKEIIQRFGHFPHRNDILGRVTTEEERIFLEGPNSRF